MGLRYYDPVSGRHRVKPRFQYAAAGFLLGLAFGIFLATQI